MARCGDCKYLKETKVSDQCGYLECVRPQGHGNRKASKEVSGCDCFKPKE